MKAKRIIAVAMAGVMALGMASSALAATIEGTSVSGQGKIEYLMNLDVKSFEVATSAKTDEVFNFIMDPQEVIDATKTQSDSIYKGKVTDTGTIYFPNLQAAVDAETASVSAYSITLKKAGEAALTATQTDSPVKVAFTISTTDPSDGTYRYDGSAWKNGDKTLGVSVSSTGDIDDGYAPDPQDGDTIELSGRVAAAAASYKYSTKSDPIEVVNKGFTDLNVLLTVTLSDMGDTIKTTSDGAFTGSTKPELFFQVVANTKDKDGTAGSPATTILFDDEKTTAYAVGSVSKNDKDDFDTKYVAASGGTAAYYEKVAKNNIKNNQYFFQLTGKCNPNGEWKQALMGTTPSVSVVWDVSQKTNSDIVSNSSFATTGKLTLDKLTKETNVQSVYLLSNYKASVYDVTNDLTWDEKAGGSTVTYTAEDGGKVIASLPSAWTNYFKGKVVYMYVTFTDGSTFIDSATIA